jgi:bifunctional DNA-binding transcriptional regulator/antitoxin component of YhaV-PrlF toxin-antitoxin module
MEGLVTFCASVLQEDLRSPEVSIYGNGRNTANPKTVLIANTNQIKNFGKMSLLNNSRRYILVDPGEQPYLWGVVSEEGRVVGTSCYHYNPNDTENTYGLEVPQEVVSHYHLKEGDFVDLVVDRDRNIVYIESVNLMTDLSEIRNRPSSLVRFTSDYPEKPLPIEKYGNFDVRVMTLLSPIGLGSSHWIVAPGGSGKTWLLNEIFDSCLQLTYEMRNLFVIMVCVGDRPEDESVYLETFQKRKRKPRGDLYSASWNTHPDHQIEVVKFAKASTMLIFMGIFMKRVKTKIIEIPDKKLASKDFGIILVIRSQTVVDQKPAIATFSNLSPYSIVSVTLPLSGNHRLSNMSNIFLL